MFFSDLVPSHPKKFGFTRDVASFLQAILACLHVALPHESYQTLPPAIRALVACSFRCRRKRAGKIAEGNGRRPYELCLVSDSTDRCNVCIMGVLHLCASGIYDSNRRYGTRLQYLHHDAQLRTTSRSFTPTTHTQTDTHRPSAPPRRRKGHEFRTTVLLQPRVGAKQTTTQHIPNT